MVIVNVDYREYYILCIFNHRHIHGLVLINKIITTIIKIINFYRDFEVN